MPAGWSTLKPTLRHSRPESSSNKQYGKWRVERTISGGKPLFKIWNHGAQTYLVVKNKEVTSTQTPSGGSDLLWHIEGRGAASSVTVQHNGQYLTAREEKIRDERAVYVTTTNKSSSKWIITCS
jgi:hypothetical protein